MTSPKAALQNLQKIGQLSPEPASKSEFNGLVLSGDQMLPDAETASLSPNSRFRLAYDAAHSFALAALRWHGFRSENRYMVFQALQHTLSFPTAKWRFLDDCHKKRNTMVYEGDYFSDEQLIKELIALAKELQAAVKALGPIQS